MVLLFVTCILFSLLTLSTTTPSSHSSFPSSRLASYHLTFSLSLLSLTLPPFFLLPHTPPLKVSSFHWDHNDSFAQFSGCHALLPDGYLSILSRLAEGLEIHLNNPVRRVEFMSDGRVGVTDSKGKLWAADRVILLSHYKISPLGSCRMREPGDKDKSRVCLHYKMLLAGLPL